MGKEEDDGKEDFDRARSAGTRDRGRRRVGARSGQAFDDEADDRQARRGGRGPDPGDARPADADRGVEERDPRGAQTERAGAAPAAPGPRRAADDPRADSAAVARSPRRALHPGAGHGEQHHSGDCEGEQHADAGSAEQVESEGRGGASEAHAAQRRVWRPRRVMSKALLIEDDRKLAALLVEFLGQHGVEATIAGDSTQALQHLGSSRFDILLLDLMLPGMDGLTLARKIRERWNTPIIMVTARGDDSDKIVGLELGADDYLAKPFNPRELLARIRAVLRRGRAVPARRERLSVGRLAIDFDAREVTVDGRRQALTAYEFELLAALARAAGRVLSRRQLLDALKGTAYETFDRPIDDHISKRRGKLEANPKEPRYIKTVRGAGYVLARDPD